MTGCPLTWMQSLRSMMMKKTVLTFVVLFRAELSETRDSGFHLRFLLVNLLGWFTGLISGLGFQVPKLRSVCLHGDWRVTMISGEDFFILSLMEYVRLTRMEILFYFCLGFEFYLSVPVVITLKVYVYDGVYAHKDTVEGAKEHTDITSLLRIGETLKTREDTFTRSVAARVPMRSPSTGGSSGASMGIGWGGPTKEDNWRKSRDRTSTPGSRTGQNDHRNGSG
ncbi:uncharacterized protein LOC122279770 isoform X1 [Carya illinoinensis]|uniref:uncharacterized protein LOC122279770 isoform X1 n=1 Tax=Carya illinoinensis TaxID=32201 RepID=UPI001C721BC2|nr:uncharacterized protein LOC122279770 isoform X1 [Carya illinoinensis]